MERRSSLSRQLVRIQELEEELGYLNTTSFVPDHMRTRKPAVPRVKRVLGRPGLTESSFTQESNRGAETSSSAPRRRRREVHFQSGDSASDSISRLSDRSEALVLSARRSDAHHSSSASSRRSSKAKHGSAKSAKKDKRNMAERQRRESGDDTSSDDSLNERLTLLTSSVQALNTGPPGNEQSQLTKNATGAERNRKAAWSLEAKEGKVRCLGSSQATHGKYLSVDQRACVSHSSTDISLAKLADGRQERLVSSDTNLLAPGSVLDSGLLPHHRKMGGLEHAEEDAKPSTAGQDDSCSGDEYSGTESGQENAPSTCHSSSDANSGSHRSQADNQGDASSSQESSYSSEFESTSSANSSFDSKGNASTETSPMSTAGLAWGDLSLTASPDNRQPSTTRLASYSTDWNDSSKDPRLANWSHAKDKKLRNERKRTKEEMRLRKENRLIVERAKATADKQSKEVWKAWLEGKNQELALARKERAKIPVGASAVRKKETSEAYIKHWEEKKRREMLQAAKKGKLEQKEKERLEEKRKASDTRKTYSQWEKAKMKEDAKRKAAKRQLLEEARMAPSTQELLAAYARKRDEEESGRQRHVDTGLAAIRRQQKERGEVQARPNSPQPPPPPTAFCDLPPREARTIAFGRSTPITHSMLSQPGRTSVPSGSSYRRSPPDRATSGRSNPMSGTLDQLEALDSQHLRNGGNRNDISLLLPYVEISRRGPPHLSFPDDSD